MVVKELQFASQPSTDTKWIAYNTEENPMMKTIELSIKEFKEEKLKLGLTPRQYVNYLINK